MRRADLLVVCARGDPLAAAIAVGAREAGHETLVLDHAAAARVFTIYSEGARARVEPCVPMFLGPALGPPEGGPDAAFLFGECMATLWAAAALSAAPVVGRPGAHGFHGRWSPSAAVTERRAGLEARVEIFASAAPGPPGGGPWAVEDASLRVHAWPAPDGARGPFRARAVLPGEAYDLVTVVGDRAWRASTVDLAAHRLEARSIEVAAHLGLEFCSVTWGLDTRHEHARLARVDAYPRLDQVAAVWDEVLDALLGVLVGARHEVSPA